MKFCYNTNFTLPKQSQGSRSILEDGSRSLGLFWNEKTSVLQPKKYGKLIPLLTLLLPHQRYTDYTFDTSCLITDMDGWMDDLGFYILFNNVIVISGQWVHDNERQWNE